MPQVNNFKRLQPTLKNFKIKLDSRIANEIIQEKSGAALQLLHKIRSVVQDTHSGSVAVQRRFQTAVATGKGTRGKEAFEDMEQHFYEELCRHAPLLWQLTDTRSSTGRAALHSFASQPISHAMRSPVDRRTALSDNAHSSAYGSGAQRIRPYYTAHACRPSQ